MDKQYNVITMTRTAQPRSKRLREVGVSGSSGGSSVIVTGSGATVTNCDGHTHANKIVLDSLSAADGYLYLREKWSNSDSSSAYKVKAGYADEAGALANENDFITKLKALFLQKLAPDEAQYLIKFLSGIEVGEYIAGSNGGKFDTDGNIEAETAKIRRSATILGDASVGGNASVGNELTVNESIEVGNYVPSVSGGTFYVDENGEAHLETADLTVTKKFKAKEVEIQQQTHVGGSQISSPAAMTCDHTEEVTDGVKCYFRMSDAEGRKIYNDFRVGDLARCETFNLQQDQEGNTANRYYWREVTAVGEETDELGDEWGYITLSTKSGEYDVDSTCLPAEGDRIITVGNRTDADRQNIIIIASYGEGSPYIYQYKGINDFVMGDAQCQIRISPNGNKFTGDFYITDGTTQQNVEELINNANQPYTLRPQSDYIFTYTDDNDQAQFNPTEIACEVYKCNGTDKIVHIPYPTTTTGMLVYDGKVLFAGDTLLSAPYSAGLKLTYTIRRYDNDTDVYSDDDEVEYSGAITPEADMRSVTFRLYQDEVLIDKSIVTIQTDSTILHRDYQASLQVTNDSIQALVESTQELDQRTSELAQRTIYLTNQMQAVGFNTAGEITSGIPSTCDVNIYNGANLETDWTITLTTTNCTATYDKSTRRITVSAYDADADSATVDIKATKNKLTPLYATMSLYASRPGEQGTSISIESTTIEYASAASGTTAPTTGWHDYIPSVSAGRYLWTRTTVVYTDGNSTVTYTVARMGTNGTSVSIDSTSVTYAITTTSAQPDDSEFTYTEMPTVELGQWLWSKIVVEYSDGTSVKYYSVSRIGADGDDGTPGKPGDNGQTTYVHFAYANSADGKTDFSTSYFKGALYIGTCTDYNETDPTDYAAYTWAELKGEMGDKGDDAIIYEVIPDITQVVVDAVDGTSDTKRVGCTVYKVQGETRTPTDEKTLKVQRVGWDSSQVEVTRTDGVYSGIPLINSDGTINTSIKSVDFILYDDDETSVLDRQGVPVTTDATQLNAQYKASLEVTDKAITALTERTTALDTRTSELEVTASCIASTVGKISRNLLPTEEDGIVLAYPEDLFDTYYQPEDATAIYEQLKTSDDVAAGKYVAMFVAIDRSKFRSNTDYTVSFIAELSQSGELPSNTPTVGGDGTTKSIIPDDALKVGISNLTQTTWLCESEYASDSNGLPYDTQIDKVYHLHSADTISGTTQMYLVFVLRLWDDFSGLLTANFWNIKLEEGLVATAFVAPADDLESVISQQADQISMAVKVDGVARAGMTLDADEGITLEADKVKVLNNGALAALFAGGILNADLIQVGQLQTIVNGKRTITISECNDSYIRFYHADGLTLAVKFGLDSVATTSAAATAASDDDDSSSSTASKAISTSATLNPTLTVSATPNFDNAQNCILQVFDEDGNLTYVLYLDGSSESPDNPTYWWKSFALVPSTAKLLTSDVRLQATEYFEFHVKSGATVQTVYSNQNGKTFTKRLKDSEFSSASSYRIDDGKYYLPNTEDLVIPNNDSSGTTTTTRIRRYYVAKSGVLTYNTSQYITVTS